MAFLPSPARPAIAPAVPARNAHAPAGSPPAARPVPGQARLRHRRMAGQKGGAGRPPGTLPR